MIVSERLDRARLNGRDSSRSAGGIAPVGAGAVRSGTDRAQPDRPGASARRTGLLPVVVEAVALGGSVVVVGQHEVPAVAAVFAAIGHDVARQPFTIFTRGSEQVTSAAAVDTDDGGLGLQHTRSLAR